MRERQLFANHSHSVDLGLREFTLKLLQAELHILHDQYFLIVHLPIR